MFDDLYDYLKDKCLEIEVTQDFIDHRDEMVSKFDGGSRSDYQRTRDADCLIIEHALIKKGYVDSPFKGDIRHDFVCKGYQVDVKLIYDWFNVSEKKRAWMMKCINAAALDVFAFYRYVTPPEGVLKVGDIVKVKLVEVETAKNVIRQLRASKRSYGGYYYAAKEYA